MKAIIKLMARLCCASAHLIAGLFCACLLFFESIGRIENLTESTAVLLAGRVAQSYPVQEPTVRAVFLLADLTGSVYVVSDDDPPAPGTWLSVKGKTHKTGVTDVVLEEARILTVHGGWNDSSALSRFSMHPSVLATEIRNSRPVARALHHLQAVRRKVGR